MKSKQQSYKSDENKYLQRAKTSCQDKLNFADILRTLQGMHKLNLNNNIQIKTKMHQMYTVTVHESITYFSSERFTRVSEQ